MYSKLQMVLNAFIESIKLKQTKERKHVESFVCEKEGISVLVPKTASMVL